MTTSKEISMNTKQAYRNSLDALRNLSGAADIVWAELVECDEDALGTMRDEIDYFMDMLTERLEVVTRRLEEIRDNA
jgi:hypothetical protein